MWTFLQLDDSRLGRRDDDSSPRRATAVRCVLLVGVLLVGCHRAYYREDADCQVYSLVNQKTSYPNWPLENYTIQTDPLSRMFDPFDPDYPPMPPDDPTSHQLMHCIYCMKGYPCWHANGDTNQVQNPNWMKSLPINDQGKVVLDAPTSLYIARLHSPDYQEQLEELYLSALDVSFERFRFDTQFSGGTGIFSTVTGADRTAVGAFFFPANRNSSSRLDVTSDLGGSKLFATGSELVVGLANTLMWEFSGPNADSFSSLINFSLVQPLLRGGGRDFVLERLTIAERTLLANVRQMERWRRGFYLEVMTGRNAGQGPSRRGGVFGGSGLVGFTGTGGGGFGSLGGGGGTAGGGGVAGGAGAAQAGGFLGLLQDQQDLVNQRANIAALQSSVVQLEEYFLAGRIDYFQVELARQALYTTQSRLLNAEAAYQTSLDRFKVTLGISQNIELVVNDELIAPFQLVDTRILPLQNRLTALQQAIGRDIIGLLSDPQRIAAGANAAFGAAVNAADQAAVNDLQNGKLNIQWSENIAQRLESIRPKLAEAREICAAALADNFPHAREDLAKLNQAIPQRQRDMAILRKRFEQRLDVSNSTSTLVADDDGQQHENPLPLEPERLKKLPSTLNDTLNELEKRFERTLAALQAVDESIANLLAAGPGLAGEALVQRISQEVVEPVPSYLTDLAADVLGLTLVQARARTESVSLVPVEISWQNAVEIARANRRDWMNSRAALVDSWRLIQFNANALESDLDVILEGEMGTLGDNPLDFRASTGRLCAGLRFDAPLNRLAERNSYRQALIEYQQARRNYYQYVDGVTASLRNTIRNLDVNQLNFELRRAAIETAIAQVELARLRLQEPPRPNEDAILGATTARDLVSALTDLLSVQNDFLSVWINQESIRRSLDFDMGTMQLAPDGVWLDPGPLVANSPYETVEATELDDDLPVLDELEQGDELEKLEQGDVPLIEPAVEGAESNRVIHSAEGPFSRPRLRFRYGQQRECPRPWAVSTPSRHPRRRRDDCRW